MISNGAEEFSNLQTQRWSTKRIKTWWICVVWRCLPLPSDEVSHSSNGEIDDIVHATSVDGINHRTPLVTLAPMRVEGGEVEGGVTWKRDT